MNVAEVQNGFQNSLRGSTFGIDNSSRDDLRAAPSDLELALYQLFLEALSGFLCLVACAVATPLLVLRLYVRLHASQAGAAGGSGRARSD